MQLTKAERDLLILALAEMEDRISTDKFGYASPDNTRKATRIENLTVKLMKKED